MYAIERAATTIGAMPTYIQGNLLDIINRESRHMPKRPDGKDSPGNAPSTRRYSKRSPEPADWGRVDAGILRSLVAVVAQTGCAIRLGYTRDGGAYALGIYGDGEPYTIYISPRDDLQEELVQLIEAFQV